MCGRSVWASSRLIFPSCFQKTKTKRKRVVGGKKAHISKMAAKQRKKGNYRVVHFYHGALFLTLFNVWV